MRKPLAWLLALVPAATVFAQSGKPAVSTPSLKDNTPIITVGKVQVPYSEFEYVYKKNNANADDAFTEKSIQEYVDLYGKFKLKVLDAERLKLDTSTNFKNELDGYRRQLAQPYLTEKSVSEKLIREAYDRMKEEVRATHILINCDPQADPKDTLKAFQKISDIRKRALAGESFDKLAKEYSDDPSAKQNNGDLGYFSAMQMVYPFENAAYNTQKGQISEPVRTRFGYHIVKVLDRRPSQGQVQVAHIMVKGNPGMPAEDSIAAVKKIQEIYQKVSKGKEDWTLAAATFSEDQGSKQQGGVLPMFGSGQMIPEFEDVAFAMKDTGSISTPFQTAYGWHIVKLLQRKPLEKYEELEPSLKTRVARDSRADLNRSALLARLRKENNFVEFPKVNSKVFTKGDTSLLSGRWRYKRADKLNKEILFSINGETKTVEDFFTFVESKQMAAPKSTPQFLLQSAYKAYVDDQMMKYEEAHLADKYEDYRMLMKEYRDGILLFTLMDQKVWTKALDDTAGLRGFYEKNKENYRWGKRAAATVYNVADKPTLEDLKAKLLVKKYPVSEPAKQILHFGKNEFELKSKLMVETRSIGFNLRNDENLVADVKGFAALGEKPGTSRKRAKIVIDSLVKSGIAATRLHLVDGGFMPKGTVDSVARKVEVTYASNSLKALERNMNVKAPLAVQITDGKFQKTENAVLDKLDWKVGDFTLLDDPTGKGRITYVVVSAVEEPRVKTLDEARGLVISDYQNQLEKDWLDTLKKENPITVNEVLVKKLIKK
jgi:peptidyl-prolyl cis-trans isomerase SurA